MPSCVADVPSCVVPSCVADVLTVAQICGRFTASKKWHSHARGKFCTRPAASFAGDVATASHGPHAVCGNFAVYGYSLHVSFFIR